MRAVWLTLGLLLIGLGTACKIEPRQDKKAKLSSDQDVDSVRSETGDDLISDNPDDQELTLLENRYGLEAQYDPVRTLNKLSFIITGQVVPQPLRGELNDVGEWVTKSQMEELVPRALKAITWNSDENLPRQAFTDWLIEYHQDIFRIEMLRRADMLPHYLYLPTNELTVSMNEEYQRRQPRRIYDPNQGFPDVGNINIAPNAPGFISDIGYYLLELEPAILAAVMVAHGAPYSSILTTRLTVSSAMHTHTLHAWKVGEFGKDPSETKLRHWTGDWHHVSGQHLMPLEDGAGVLATQAMLYHYDKPREWARNVYRMFLCQEIRPVPNKDSIDFSYYKAETGPPLARDGCKGCHFMLDGISNLRFYFYPQGFRKDAGTTELMYMWRHFKDLMDPNDPGRVAETLNGNRGTQLPGLDMDHYLLGADGETFESVKGVGGLTKALADHPQFSQCAVERIFKALFRRQPETKRDQLLVERALLAYRNSNNNFLAALENLAMQPDFYVLAASIQE